MIVIESKQVKVKCEDYLIKNPGARWIIKLDDELKNSGENFGSYDLKDFSDRLLSKAVDGELPADEEVQEELFNEILKFIGLSIKEETIDGEKIMYFDFEP